MKSWRVNWVMDQIAQPYGFAKHRDALDSPLTFWIAVVAKLVPNLWKPRILLRLKNQGVISVKEFMTLYVYNEIFVDKCYDLPKLPMQDPVIVDVGANTGLFAIRMWQLYPKATLSCYEPMPSNFRELQESLRANQILNGFPHQEGVGGTTRTEKLFIHARNVGGHSVYSNVASSEKSLDIRLVSIKTVLDRLQGRACNLLKLDCEGAEYEILKALDADDVRRVERIIFEPTPAVYDIDELKTHLRRIGYDVEWNEGIYIATRHDLLESPVS